MTILRNCFVALLCLTAVPGDADTALRPQDYFAVQVVDEQTGRGVPMVELTTTSCRCYETDSAGWVAFYEPGLMNQTVWFNVASHGYAFPADAYGQRGVKLKVRPGATSIIKIERLNIAERLYRITGAGIYRDSVLLGHKMPIAHPLLNAEVVGQDGILNAIYHGKLYWFYGDTLRLSYNLGNYSMTGATTPLPAKLDPAAGFDLHYFTRPDGFVRAMAPMEGKGVVWLFGLQVFPGADGGERMVAFYQRRLGMGDVLDNGFVEYNDAREKFEKIKTVPLNPSIFPQGYPLRVRETNGVEYIYFATPYPALRVRADLDSYLNLAEYEGYTCMKLGSSNEVERDAEGKLVWSWQKNSPPLHPGHQERLIKAGLLKREESPFRLQAADSKKPILLNSCSCCWNAYRKRYVMIASEVMGATMLGEIWYAESDRPEGPWSDARKIITHANKPHDAHDFYNPAHHDFFDQDGGRVIYLEGSYVNTFSGNAHATPDYEYNQIMYRLDLADPRLRLP